MFLTAKIPKPTIGGYLSYGSTHDTDILFKLTFTYEDWEIKFFVLSCHLLCVSGVSVD